MVHQRLRLHNKQGVGAATFEGGNSKPSNLKSTIVRQSGLRKQGNDAATSKSITSKPGNLKPTILRQRLLLKQGNDAARCGTGRRKQTELNSTIPRQSLLLRQGNNAATSEGRGRKPTRDLKSLTVHQPLRLTQGNDAATFEVKSRESGGGKYMMQPRKTKEEEVGVDDANKSKVKENKFLESNHLREGTHPSMQASTQEMALAHNGGKLDNSNVDNTSKKANLKDGSGSVTQEPSNNQSREGTTVTTMELSSRADELCRTLQANEESRQKNCQEKIRLVLAYRVKIQEKLRQLNLALKTNELAYKNLMGTLQRASTRCGALGSLENSEDESSMVDIAPSLCSESSSQDRNQSQPEWDKHTVDSERDDSEDYSYSRASSLSEGPFSVSSDGGTLGDSTITENRSLSTNDTPSYLTKGWGDLANGEVRLEVFVPSGKLGLLIGAPNGIPVVHSISAWSCATDKLMPGDKIVAVDNEDCSYMSGAMVTELLTRKNGNPTRKFTVLREQIWL